MDIKQNLHMNTRRIKYDLSVTSVYLKDLHKEQFQQKTGLCIHTPKADWFPEKLNIKSSCLIEMNDANNGSLASECIRRRLAFIELLLFSEQPSIQDSCLIVMNDASHLQNNPV